LNEYMEFRCFCCDEVMVDTSAFHHQRVLESPCGTTIIISMVKSARSKAWEDWVGCDYCSPTQTCACPECGQEPVVNV